MIHFRYRGVAVSIGRSSDFVFRFYAVFNDAYNTPVILRGSRRNSLFNSVIKVIDSYSSHV